MDLLVVVFLVRGVYLGYKRGLSGELLRFIGILIALYLSVRFYEPLSNRLIEKSTLDHSAAIASAFAAIFLGVLVFFYLVNRVVRQMAELPLIAAVERAGGALLGGMKTLLFACVVLILLALVRVEAISNAVSRDSFFGALAISSVPGAYRLAVRVYPEVKRLPAEEVIEKLPTVSPDWPGVADEQGAGARRAGEREAGSSSEDSDYIVPDERGRY
ncbi:TPA: CvpA family protein [Candidatus Bipolaricaulota bacterium]|nr:CvpA family protein [Candidatus Bipolaricaulota bacterium]